MSYQMFQPLRPEERDALKADIARRGVMVPVEVDDETGELLDGHHRASIAQELGIDCPTVRRTFASEAEKREHVLKLNLLRRHIGPIAWADAFRKLAEARGVRLDERARNDRGGLTAANLAAELGVPPRTARRRLELADKLADHPDLAAQVDAGGVAPWSALVRARLQGQPPATPPPPLPSDNTYRCLVADPPWDYDDRRNPRGAGAHYGCMPVAEICALPVAGLAAPNAHLYLWTTNAFMDEGHDVCRAWGFQPRTILTWVKHRLGIGYYFRNTTEHVIFATRGSLPPLRHDLPTHFEAPRRAHSQKPDELLAIAEAATPGPRIELFARRGRPGWDAWGNEAPSEAALVHA